MHIPDLCKEKSQYCSIPWPHSYKQITRQFGWQCAPCIYQNFAKRKVNIALFPGPTHISKSLGNLVGSAHHAYTRPLQREKSILPLFPGPTHIRKSLGNLVGSAHHAYTRPLQREKSILPLFSGPNHISKSLGNLIGSAHHAYTRALQRGKSILPLFSGPNHISKSLGNLIGSAHHAYTRALQREKSIFLLFPGLIGAVVANDKCVRNTILHWWMLPKEMTCHKQERSHCVCPVFRLYQLLVWIIPVALFETTPSKSFRDVYMGHKETTCLKQNRLLLQTGFEISSNLTEKLLARM